MKKYLLGMLAIVLAIGFSAFTKAPVFADTKVFTLDSGISLTNSTAIADPTNWTYQGNSLALLCPSSSDLACSFAVDPSKVDGSNELQNVTINVVNGIEINQVQYYKVGSVTGSGSYSSSQIANRAN